MDDRVIDRMESEARAFKRITNNDLVCKDCLYKLDDSKILGNTSFCRVYARPDNFKPSKIVGGGDCKYYKKA